MNSFGQNTVELFLIWSLEDCHLIFFFTYNNIKSEKTDYKTAGPESQLSLNISQSSLGV